MIATMKFERTNGCGSVVRLSKPSGTRRTRKESAHPCGDFLVELRGFELVTSAARVAALVDRAGASQA
jgi:hypothetical protein